MTAANMLNGRSDVQSERARAEAHLAELRGKLREALVEKKSRLRDFVDSCKADRRAIREQVQGMRARSLRDLRDQVVAARGAAKLTRLTRLAEVRQVANDVVARVRALAAVERQHQAELGRIANDERSRRVEIRLAHERALVASDLRSSILGKLAPLFGRERAIKAAPGESRAEALLRFAERNPEKAHAAIEPHVHRRVEETKRAISAAERAVRVAGRQVRSAAVRRPTATNQEDRPGASQAKAARGTALPRGEKRPAASAKASPAQSPALPLAAPTPISPATVPARPPDAPKAPKKSLRGASPKKDGKARGAKVPPTKVANTPSPGSKAAPKRRKGQIPPGGMPLEDLMRERAEMAAAKAARAKGTASKKPKEPPSSPPTIPPRAAPVHVTVTGAPPSNDVERAPFTTAIAESVKPYKVRASCGHIVVRPMREATARVPYSPDVVLDAPKGRACDACEAKKNFSRHAPNPAPKKEVKAPELTDTAEIAKRIRADIHEAVRKGELPKGKYAVRTSKYSMGSSIDVVASALPSPMLNPAAFRLDKGSSHMTFDRDKFHTRYTPEAERVLLKLGAIVDAYHWDRSDLQSDYHHARFSRDVRLDDEAEWRRINAERVAAARASQSGTAQP